MNVTLTLRYSQRPLRPGCAWFVPSGRVSDWLAVICAAPWDQAKLRLAVVPTSDSDPGPCGVLLIPALSDASARGTAGAAPTLHLWPLPQAYGSIGGVYLPVEAEPSAPIADRQWTELLPSDDAIYVWRPGAPLLHVPKNALLSVADLLGPPVCDPTAWDAAQPGMAVNMRLLSLQPDVALSFEALLEQAAGDIGSQGGEWQDLPAQPGESLLERGLVAIENGLARVPGLSTLALRVPRWVWLALLGGSIVCLLALLPRSPGALAWYLLLALMLMFFLTLLAFSRAIARRSSASPPPAAEPGGSAARPAGAGGRKSWWKSLWSKAPGVSQVQGWANNQLSKVQERLDEVRHREIARLMRTLESDPDQGLKFALPLHGQPHRGRAAPSNQLSQRSVDFSLRSLWGGRAADPWDLNPLWHERLRTKYQELARREIAVGRHRRAAYIYAELLGDYASAATTLASGGHYREAAVLYEEKLHQPLLAADCLRKGGLLTEAIVLYERLQKWEIVGQLYRELDQPQQAREAYTKAMNVAAAAGQFIVAANLAEKYLDSRDLAWEKLQLAWPGSSQARQCLARSFELAGQWAEHPRALRHIDWARRHGPSQPQQATLAGVLADVATTYPDQQIRARAADETRLLASAHLDDARPETAAVFTQALERLAPTDRMLTRDCDRYRRQRAAASVPAPPPPRPASGKVSLLRQWKLPLKLAMRAVGDGKSLFVAGWHDDSREIVVVRGDVQGHWQTTANSVPGPKSTWPPILAWDGRANSPVVFHVPIGMHDAPRFMFPHNDQFSTTILCGQIAGLQMNTVAVAYGRGGQVLIATAALDGCLSLARYDRPGGTLLGTQSYEQVKTQSIMNLFLGVHGDRVFCAAGTLFWELLGNGTAIEHELDQVVHEMACSNDQGFTRLALGTQLGVELAWLGGGQTNRRLLVRDAKRPRVALTASELIVATHNEIQVFRTDLQGITWLAEAIDQSLSPIAVLPLTEPREFLVVSADGEVRHFRW